MARAATVNFGQTQVTQNASRPLVPSPSTGIPLCIAKWDCTDWTLCTVNGKKARRCVDTSGCGTVAGKPQEEERCVLGIETGDSEAPAVRILRPKVVRTLFGRRLRIEANVTDNETVEQVELTLGSHQSKIQRLSPYRYHLRLTDVRRGSYRLTVKATDPSGNMATKISAVRINW